MANVKNFFKTNRQDKNYCIYRCGGIQIAIKEGFPYKTSNPFIQSRLIMIISPGKAKRVCGKALLPGLSMQDVSSSKIFQQTLLLLIMANGITYLKRGSSVD